MKIANNKTLAERERAYSSGSNALKFSLNNIQLQKHNHQL